jgi:hypothetical protein
VRKRESEARGAACQRPPPTRSACSLSARKRSLSPPPRPPCTPTPAAFPSRPCSTHSTAGGLENAEHSPLARLGTAVTAAVVATAAVATTAVATTAVAPTAVATAAASPLLPSPSSPRFAPPLHLPTPTADPTRGSKTMMALSLRHEHTRQLLHDRAHQASCHTSSMPITITTPA